jgi:hypothetical protein
MGRDNHDSDRKAPEVLLVFKVLICGDEHIVLGFGRTKEFAVLEA